MVTEVENVDGTTTASSNELANPRDIDMAASALYTVIQDQGGATRKELRQWAVSIGMPTDVFQKAFDGRLKRQLDLIVETGSGTEKMIFLQEWAKGLSLAQIVAAKQSGTGATKPKESYTDWYEASGTLTFQLPMLAGNPAGNGEANKRTFYRDPLGRVSIPSGNIEAMFKEVSILNFAPNIGNARYKVAWESQYIDPSVLQTVERPVPPSRPGMGGQGLTEVESIPPGVALPFSAMVPGSHISPEQFTRLLELAGKYIGLGAAHHKGFGRFQVEVTAIRVQTDE